MWNAPELNEDEFNLPQLTNSHAESFSTLIGTSNKFWAFRVCVKEFHQTNQETFILLLVEEVAIRCNLLTCIFGYKELVT